MAGRSRGHALPGAHVRPKPARPLLPSTHLARVPQREQMQAAGQLRQRDGRRRQPVGKRGCALLRALEPARAPLHSAWREAAMPARREVAEDRSARAASQFATCPKLHARAAAAVPACPCPAAPPRCRTAPPGARGWRGRWRRLRAPRHHSPPVGRWREGCMHAGLLSAKAWGCAGVAVAACCRRSRAARPTAQVQPSPPAAGRLPFWVAAPSGASGSTRPPTRC